MHQTRQHHPIDTLSCTKILTKMYTELMSKCQYTAVEASCSPFRTASPSPRLGQSAPKQPGVHSGGLYLLWWSRVAVCVLRGVLPAYWSLKRAVDSTFEYRMNEYPRSEHQPDFQLVSLYNFVLLYHQLRHIPCAINIASRKPFPFFLRQIDYRIGTQFSRFHKNYNLNQLRVTEYHNEVLTGLQVLSQSLLSTNNIRRDIPRVDRECNHSLIPILLAHKFHESQDC